MKDQKHRNVFYRLLANSLVATISNTFIWFALTFWVFIETKSVLATSLIAGSFAVFSAVSSLFFGAIVDHHKKKNVMLGSSLVTLAFYIFGALIYFGSPDTAFNSHGSPILWAFILVLMLGSIVGNLRIIALSTSVSLLFSDDKRAKANGMIGTMNGISFSLTSILSGLVIGFLGMGYALIFSILFTALVVIHLLTFSIPEKVIAHGEEKPKNMDVMGTIRSIRLIPGLFALIFFTTFNNFLGGVFMSLMDAYGLSLVSVETWGFLWGFLSLGFIVGGVLIAKYGLGNKPLKRLMTINMITWTVCIFFTIKSSIILTSIGLFAWMILVPFIEAIEQTVIQKVVPYERQGRVFGFAHSVESAASPITAFLIGPIAQFFFIPFMTTGAGVGLIGGWFGTGPARGIALVFTLAGIIGLIMTIIARRSKSYKVLSKAYAEHA